MLLRLVCDHGEPRRVDVMESNSLRNIAQISGLNWSENRNSYRMPMHTDRLCAGGRIETPTNLILLRRKESEQVGRIFGALVEIGRSGVGSGDLDYLVCMINEISGLIADSNTKCAQPL
jgi:hypothetical protein